MVFIVYIVQIKQKEKKKKGVANNCEHNCMHQYLKADLCMNKEETCHDNFIIVDNSVIYTTTKNVSITCMLSVVLLSSQ